MKVLPRELIVAGLVVGVYAAAAYKLQVRVDPPSDPLSASVALQVMSCSQQFTQVDDPIWQDVQNMWKKGMPQRIAAKIANEAKSSDAEGIGYCLEAAKAFYEHALYNDVPSDCQFSLSGGHHKIASAYTRKAVLEELGEIMMLQQLVRWRNGLHSEVGKHQEEFRSIDALLSKCKNDFGQAFLHRDNPAEVLAGK